MKFVEYKKGWISKLVVGVILLFLGAVLGQIGTMVAMILNKPEPKDIEALRLQDTITYITSEQARLGIDCGDLRHEIHTFLATEIMPVLDARQPGTGWSTKVSEEMRNRMDNLLDSYFACGRLYREARNVNWDGMGDLGFSIELDNEVIITNTLLRFSNLGEECGAKCLNNKYRDSHEAVARIVTHTTSNEGVAK